jgi:hypothetical protein
MSQVGYGQSDTIGSPFQTVNAVANQAITVTSNKLMLTNAASVAGVAVTLPLNPPDGAVVEIFSIAGTTASSVAANTGDTLTSAPAGLGALVTFTANTKFRYEYSLNGDIVGTGQPARNARCWFRTA